MAFGSIGAIWWPGILVTLEHFISIDRPTFKRNQTLQDLPIPVLCGIKYRGPNYDSLPPHPRPDRNLFTSVVVTWRIDRQLQTQFGVERRATFRERTESRCTSHSKTRGSSQEDINNNITVYRLTTTLGLNLTSQITVETTPCSPACSTAHIPAR